VAAAVVGAIALVLYLATLPAGLTWAHHSADGADLALAAYSLGIAHPPGYPAYVLLAHPWTLLPFGEVATRTNLFSAVCSAGVAAALAWALVRSGRHWIAAIVGALSVAGAPLFWSQAIVTEVHALHGLFCTLILAAAVVAQAQADGPSSPGAALAAATGLLWGLSLGNSPTALFLAPLVLLVLWGRPRRIGWACAGLVTGLVVYALPPLRARASPAASWGDPATLDGFFWLVTGSLYRRYVFALPLGDAPGRLLSAAQLLTRQFGVAGLAVAAAGVFAGAVNHGRLWAAIAVSSLLSGAFAVGYDTTDSHLYLIPGVIYCGFWLGAGMDWLLSMAAMRARLVRSAVVIGAVSLLAVTIVCRLPEVSLRHDRGPEALRRRVLDLAPPQALVLSDRDAYTFALWYYQRTCGLRPDTTVVDVGLLGLDWYNARVDEDLGRPGSAALLQSSGHADPQSAAEELGRPVCRIVGDDPLLTCAEG
jgi:hypothetical protein